MNRKLALLSIFGLLLLLACKEKIESGVSQQLANQRKQTLSNIEYNIYIDIPESENAPVPGRVELMFELNERYNLPIDFRNADSCLLNVTVNYRQISANVNNGHVIIPKSYLYQGQNKIAIDFLAGKTSLNRKGDYLFSLLVPDRASTVFPCFDQPNLKASYNLTLQTPKDWVAVSNSPVINKMETDTSNLWIFDKTYPISTYLFAFTAGKFKAIDFVADSFKMTIYHRETDTQKVARNIKTVFELHQSAIKWLENYTRINYPFQKLDVVLIPDFPYSGMEHQGAIFYRDSRILLDENSSVTQQLNQANLIAHEVSHQWFGNLVTMNWFNDVWLKEVFAGLMADKIVNPQYPKLNHQLSFVLSHYPRAYSVDRTGGANPIRQNLDNLMLAGTLYGDIIYHKAPIALQQLELMLGEDKFREGLNIYLKKYAYSNAGWNELIEIFDNLSSDDIKSWSKRWIDAPGMPAIYVDIVSDVINISQTDNWLPMEFEVMIPTTAGYQTEKVRLNGKHTEIPMPKNFTGLKAIIPNSNGLGYGLFVSADRDLTLLQLNELANNDVARASFFINLHELFLNHLVDTDTYFRFLANALSREKDPQIRNYLLGNLETVWWQFLDHTNQIILSQTLQEALQGIFNNPKIPADERKPAFLTYCRTSITPEAVEFIENIWAGRVQIKGISLSENDFIDLSFQLAVRDVHDADSILQVQEERIQNADRLAKFRFVRRAATPDEALRDDFFHSLLIAQNRRPEPWVAEGLRLFFHPLRANHSIHYLNAALDLLPEIQQTNDIFFPKTWLDAVLYGHSSTEAAKIVTKWIQEHPQLSPNLKGKLMQSADLLFRAAGSK
ncbi:MAG TPA: M1 family aminopeptidase [Tenuifilum sp.]|nr:M1 family aminopeptidase [Tenuifilum sp.]